MSRASTCSIAHAARRALEASTWRGPVVQAFLLARLFVAPLGPMDRELRQLRGRVLSLGCGHGIVDRYLAEINPEVTVDGVDLDADRVAVAQATADRAPRALRAGRRRRRALDEIGSYDAALAVDVLHHVPRESHRAIAAALYRLVEPGGQVLVQEMARTPRRQYLWNRLHDRIVAGPEPLACLDPEERERGPRVRGVRRDRGAAPPAARPLPPVPRGGPAPRRQRRGGSVPRALIAGGGTVARLEHRRRHERGGLGRAPARRRRPGW